MWYFEHLGIKTLAQLHSSFVGTRNSCVLCDIVANHMLTDDGLVQELNATERGSVDFVVLEMKRIVLFEQAVKETRELAGLESVQVDKNRCTRCLVQYYYEKSTSTNICPQCGTTVFVIENDHQDFNSRSRYNQAPKHYYAAHEHFFQSLLDVTCTGSRKVPIDVVRYCRSVTGHGPQVTFRQVFRALQFGGYKQYYMLKYEIAAQLRGRPEIVLSMRETEKVRGHYWRYDKCFNEFQNYHDLGTKTISNRNRLFWPVRFIMAEIFKLIGRSDLLPSLKQIAESSRKKAYISNWKKLTTWVDRRTPVVSRVEYRPQLTRLPPPPKRLKYSRPPAPG